MLFATTISLVVVNNCVQQGLHYSKKTYSCSRICGGHTTWPREQKGWGISQLKVVTGTIGKSTVKSPILLNILLMVPAQYIQ